MSLKTLKNTKLRQRKIQEKLFRFLGIISISFAIFMLLALLYSVFSKGYTAFYTNTLSLDITLTEQNLIKAGLVDDDYSVLNYDIILQESLSNTLKVLGYTKEINYQNILSQYEAKKIQYSIVKGTDINKPIRLNFLLNSNSDMYFKQYIGSSNIINGEVLKVLNLLKDNNYIKKSFNSTFFKNADSRNPELAGIRGALIGSIYTILLTIIFSVIISIGAAIYLEEFAAKNRLMSFIEVNINNLAAIPSIVFGLLGLIVFQQFFGIPRATPLLASFVLTLMSLPTIIITSRIAISSVPSSIKEAAYGLGSSKVQVISRHIIPISMPGILTGIIIGISRAIGETAPLLMIGMVAFINSVPTSITSNANVFPVQILLWSDSPEIGFIEKASAAIMLLLVFLMLINWLAIYLRNKFEIKF